MQAKDIPEQPIIEFLLGLNRWACCWPGFDNSVLNAMPEGTPEKVGRAKMRAMIRKGIIEGCACGCRGDFRIAQVNGAPQKTKRGSK